MLKKNLLLAASVMSLFFATSASAVWAQDDDAADTSQAASFVFKPSIEIKEVYEDNIYTERSQRNDDFITQVTPKIVVDAPVGKPNKLQFNAGLTQSWYGDSSDDNRLDYNAGFKGRAKLDNALTWEAAADYRKLHSDRGDDEANPTNDAKEPLEFTVARGTTSLTGKSGDFTFKPRLGMTHFNFDDYTRTNNAKVDQDYRDRSEYVAGGRVSYDLHNAYEVFADAEFAPRNYRISSATERDSDGGSYLVGLTYKPSKEFRTSVAVGYMNRNYDRAVYDDINALDVDASAQWNYEEGSLVKIAVARSIAEVTDVNVGGAVRSDIRGTVTKKLTDALTGKVEARYSNVAYEGGNGSSNGSNDRENNFYEATIGATYALDENISFTGDYTYGNNQSNLASSEYDRNVVMVGVKYGF